MAEEKQPVDANNEQSNVAPTPEQLGVADLKLAASIIEVVNSKWCRRSSKQQRNY